MNLESLDKLQSDAELRKAIIYLCKYGDIFDLFISLTMNMICSDLKDYLLIRDANSISKHEIK